MQIDREKAFWPSPVEAGLRPGKENYFFKKKFISDSKKRLDRLQDLTQVGSFQNCSNALSFLDRRVPAQVKAPASRGYLGGLEQKLWTGVGASFNKHLQVSESVSKRRNKSLSIKKFSLEKGATSGKGGIFFCKSFAQNPGLDKLQITLDKPRSEVTVAGLVTELEKKIQAALADADSGAVSPRKTRKKVARLLTTYSQTAYQACEKQRSVAFLELGDFLKRRAEDVKAKLAVEEPVTQSVGVQSSPPEFSLTKFVADFKEFSVALLREGPKAEFKTRELTNFLEARGTYIEETDFETQKLLKCFCDTVQKQLVFEEIIKILEEENIQVEEFLQQSYERVMNQLISEREALVHDGDDPSLAQSEAARPSRPSRPSEPSSPMDLRIDLAELKREKSDKSTPLGFHQEFLGLADEFSPSWRKQLEKEKRGK